MQVIEVLAGTGDIPGVRVRAKFLPDCESANTGERQIEDHKVWWVGVESS